MAQHNQFISVVKEIIEQYGSENNPIKSEKINKMIKDRFRDEACERKTVGRILKQLREEYGVEDEDVWKNPKQRLHYNVYERDSSDICNDYWFEYRGDGNDLTDGEIMFLMDAVQFSRHISKKDAEKIMKKLLLIAPDSFKNDVPDYKKIDDDYRPVSEHFFEGLKNINKGIRDDRKISFHRTEYNLKLKRVRVTDSPLTVNPITVVSFDGNYYLIFCEKGSSVIKNCRVDMISDVKVLDESCDVDDMEIRNIKKHPEEYIVEHQYMSSGAPVEAVLQIDRGILGDVVEAFGPRIKVDDDDSDALTVYIRSSEKGIIDWALKNGEYAEVVEPDYLRELIKDRSSRIYASYQEGDYEIYYREKIAEAGRTRRLMLLNINLNERELHRDLKGIRTASFRNNKITDFSFLTWYEDLEDLSIANNRISDTDFFTELQKLRCLNLMNTGITDLEFLRDLDRIRRLSIKEVTLENVDAIYDLPELRFLNVNKPVARLIDTKRLKKVYGDSLTYTVGEGVGLIPSMSRNLPSKDNHFIKREADRLKDFAVIAVADPKVRTRLAESVEVGIRSRDKMFTFIDGSGDSSVKVKLYENINEFTSPEYTWYVSYDGTAPETEGSFDAEQICGILIYKRDHGLKQVAMFRREIRDSRNDEDKYSKTYTGLRALIRYTIDNRIGWAEVSGGSERVFCHVCTMDDIIDPAALKNGKIIKEIKIDEDGYHYHRREEGGKKSVRRIAYGHIDS